MTKVTAQLLKSSLYKIEDSFNVDSGATHHICSKYEHFFRNGDVSECSVTLGRESICKGDTKEEADLLLENPIEESQRVPALG